ncbi:MAG: citrate synthase family protein [Roseibium sp.]|nr:citrate synthase family protein [Roseibium sp.]
MSEPIYLSAREAAAELGVQPATLYAYVSRGIIRSVKGPGKQRRYDASDVRTLLANKSEDAGSAATGISQGERVLETRLTLISQEVGPVYRGRPARDLARTSSLEAVATLLWDCDSDPFAQDAPGGAPVLPNGLSAIDRLTMALAAWPLQDRAALTLSGKLLPKKGALLLRYGLSALLGGQPATDPIHMQLSGAWGVATGHADVVRAALVLCADHELNTSAFAVRCAASTRAPLHAALLSGLGAFSGPRHGAAPDRVAAWLSDIKTPEDAHRTLAGRLARGETLPGFGHRIYRDRDPRADRLLAIIGEVAPDNAVVRALPALIETAEDLYGLAPNIDFALTVLQKAYDLPPDAAKILFCSGRMVGWIAHALEQYGSPDQIRPRAAYVGARPRSSGQTWICSSSM